MKKVFSILLLFVTILSVNAQSTKIDFDYSKLFNVKSLFIDYNGNGEFDEGEYYEADDNFEIFVLVKHKDFGEAGNLSMVKIDFKNKIKNESLSYICDYEDIDLNYSKEKDEDGMEYFTYAWVNKLGEVELGVIEKKEDVTVGLFNFARMRKVEE